MKLNNLHIALNQLDPARISLARELRGFYKKDLAEKLNLTPSAITQFESGKSKPTSETFSKLCLALGLNPNFFKFKGKNYKIIPTDACHFRSLRSANQIERRQILAKGTVLAELANKLENFVDFPREDLSTYNNVFINSLTDIEKFALEIRIKWNLGLGPISNIINLLEQHGVIVFKIPNHSKRLDAFSTWYLNRPCIFLSSEKDSPSRSRFDAAHELGHLLMHTDIIPGDRKLEEQANRFASAFLLPIESYSKECPKKMSWGHWEHFYELKRRWKVSIPALIRRAWELGKISEATYHRAFVNYNKDIRNNERNEPPVENPKLILKTLILIEERGRNFELRNIFEEIGLNDRELKQFLNAA